MINRNTTKSKARQIRVRKKLRSRSIYPRLSIFRSNQKIYAQIIDDAKKITLASSTESEIPVKDKTVTKLKRAQLVGEIIAKKASKAKIKKVVFDRGKFKFHGRVKALAQAARSQGLEF